jgi:hypothetical protein
MLGSLYRERERSLYTVDYFVILRRGTVVPIDLTMEVSYQTNFCFGFHRRFLRVIDKELLW